MGGKTPFPFARYTVPAGAGVSLGGIATYAAEQAVSQLPFWAQLPWTDIIVLLVGLMLGWMLGLLYADLCNEDSQLRGWFRDRNVFGEFGRTTFSKSYYDPGANRGGKRAYIDIIVPFTFGEDTKLLSVRVASIKRALHLTGDRESPLSPIYQWRSFEQDSFIQGESINIIVACVAIDPTHGGFYGDLKEGIQTILEDYVFKIDILSAKNSQSKMICVRFPHHDQDMAIHGSYQGDRFFLVEDGHPRFQELKDRLRESPSKRSVWHWIAFRH